ncbi:MAG: CotH kinase family protein [Bacteroidaceae bacterium]|nr:CotH kinase family protein [Bacteroidaceae bacterium]
MLRVSSSETGAVVRYTTDGSEPTAESPQFTSNLYIDSTTIIRAAEFKGDVRSSDVVTVSYIFPSTVLEQPAAPEGYPDTWGKYSTINGTAPADYEMDPELVSDRTYSKRITDAFFSIPVLSIVTDRGNLFNKEKDEHTGGIYIYTGTSDSDGRGWERPASVELMGSGHDLSVDCALKIHGGQGRVAEKNPKHSFRLTFKDEYGKKTLKYPVFGEENVARFNSLIMRTFYNYSWLHADATQRSRAQYGRDLWARRMQKRMGYDTSDGLYVNVFINGLYWGLYNLSERIDDDYCKYHFGGLKSDYDVIKREDYLEAAEGTLDKWNQLMRLSDKISSQMYKVITGQVAQSTDSVPEVFLDVDNFIDYMLINQYCGNNDWDHHNWIALTNREDPSQGFRFICWDSEQTLYSASKNVLDVNNKDCPTYLFQNMMKCQAFRHRFMDRAYKHLQDDGGLLRPQSTQALWDSLQSVISLAIYAESARWGDYRKDVHPYSSQGELYRADVHHALENRRLMEEFFPQRTETLIAQLKKKGWYATVEAPAFLVNGKKVADGDTILLSDELTLANGSYIVYTTDGSYPVLWEDNTLGGETSQSILYSKENLAPFLVPGEVTLRAISKSGSTWSATITRSVYVVDDQTDGIAEVNNERVNNERVNNERVKSEKWDNSWYTLDGQMVNGKLSNSKLPKGVYIINGKKKIR